jgi:AraC family transcriptional regulator, regulatory protein of adaptative response / methylated-DNA-[protein]-cysteine methyltransferase
MGKALTINYYRIERAIHFITTHFKDQPDLDEIAQKVNLSPFHFQRLFLDWVGLTPKKFLQFVTIDYLKSQLHRTNSVIDAANLVGLSSQSRVYDLFVKIEGVSPQEFKSAGQGLKISYGYHVTPFGMCFIAMTERGVCDLHFIDEDGSRDEFERFSHKWSFAELKHQPDVTQPFIQKALQPGSKKKETINLVVQATDFQIKVWEALVNIPFGSVRSYQQIAYDLGHPGSIRAVASAAGRNPILYLIPCHRIITKDGTVGNFQYGKVRKQTMIAWEMATLSV